MPRLLQEALRLGHAGQEDRAHSEDEGRQVVWSRVEIASCCRAVVDPALKLMIDAARRYDGYVVQSTGDGIFALFGAPVAHEDHPQLALYAALRMQEELERYSTRLRAGGNLPIEARVGVNTGGVVVPTKNSESREKSRVLGRTVVVSSVWLSACVPSSPLLRADSVVGRFWN
jgi:class 3 adenylate cyclase